MMCHVQECQLSLSYFLSYFHLMISDAISCPLHNLKTVWNIIMIHHSYVEQVMTMYCVQEWQLSFLYFLSYLPATVKATMPFILNTEIFSWDYRVLYKRSWQCVLCIKYGGSCVHILSLYTPPPPKKRVISLEWCLGARSKIFFHHKNHFSHRIKVLQSLIPR